MPHFYLNLVVAGHVDHGKSTLVGRLLHETRSLDENRVEEARNACRRRGVPFEWSFLLDAFQAERDQGVTIDTAQAVLRLPGRDVLLIDAPGHREFQAKALTGASLADAALLVVDAVEGLRAETRRHAEMLALLGVKTMIIAVTKMDAVAFDQARFTELHSQIVVLCRSLEIASHAVIPVSAATGDNLMRASAEMPWWRGNSLSELIATLPLTPKSNDQPLRLPIQDIYRTDDRRVYVGRIESGRLRVGDEITLSPANKSARIASIEIWPETLETASAGQSIGVTLDRPIFVERGDVLSHRSEPPLLAAQFHANLLWLGTQPAAPGIYYRLRMGTAEMPVLVEPVASETSFQDSNGIGRALLRSPRLMVLDDAGRLPRTGRFVLYHDEAVVAVGLTDLTGVADKRQRSAALVPSEHRVATSDRSHRFGHHGGVLWLTGLSGAGKSTLAMAVEEVLFRKGYAVYVLDGDNLRAGLNVDLGFAAADRVENMRRTGEAAALFADAGLICIAALISPYAEDRARARAAARGAFHEVYLSADLKTCEARDPKGLYRRARTGEIAEFTGVSAPYEAPASPELVVDTASEPVAASIARIVAYVERHFGRIGIEKPISGEAPSVLVEFPANLRIAG